VTRSLTRASATHLHPVTAGTTLIRFFFLAMDLRRVPSPPGWSLYAAQPGTGNRRPWAKPRGPVAICNSNGRWRTRLGSAA
jgi:hypothetical protein